MLRSGCWRRALVHRPRQRSPRRLCRWMEKRGRRSRTRQRPDDRLIVYSLAATFRARASLEQRSRMDALSARSRYHIFCKKCNHGSGHVLPRPAPTGTAHELVAPAGEGVPVS